MDYENQKMIEEFFNKRQTLPLLRSEFMRSQSVMDRIQESGLNPDFCLDALSHIALAKRHEVSAMVGLLKHHCMSHQEAADGLQTMCEHDLMDYDRMTQQIIVRFEPGQKTQDLLKQYQYLPPMLVPPLEVKTNRGSGYLTLPADSLILQDNHHDGDICLDSINRFNQVALSANLEVVRNIRNHWKDIDSPRDGENISDYKKRRDAFEVFEKYAFFTIALMAEMGNEFYLTHKYDKRGRTYCQGYHINYQGNSWCKAVVEFAEKELVNV